MNRPGKKAAGMILVAMLIGLSSSASAGGVLNIVSWTGDVTVGDLPLAEGQSLPAILEGTVVQTGEDGNLFARYDDGSQLRLKEDSIATITVIDPDGESQTRRFIELQAGTVEYLADPKAVVDLRITTVRGDVFTRAADVSVRIDAYEGSSEFACVIVHNVDHTSMVEGRPDAIMTVLKEEVELTGGQSGQMNPGSVLVLCARLERTLHERTRRAIETSADAVPIVRVTEASPFREVLIFDF